MDGDKSDLLHPSSPWVDAESPPYSSPHPVDRESPPYTPSPTPNSPRPVTTQPLFVRKRQQLHHLHHYAPSPMVVSLAMLMVCFVMGTPLSLFLTIPAYILTDKAETLLEKGEERKAKRLLRLSYALNGAVVIMGVLSVAVFVCLYVASVSDSKAVHTGRR